MGQVAGKRQRHGEARRIAQSPLIAQREIARGLAAAGALPAGSSRIALRDRLVARGIGQSQHRVESKVRVELEVKWLVGRLELPRIGQPGGADTGLEHQAMGAIGLEIAGENA